MRPLVIGIGHSDRGDDHVGVDVARQVADAGRDADVLVWSGPPLLLLDHWHGRQVIVVDAMRSGRPPGTVITLDEAAIPSCTWAVSSHDIGIAQAFVLARTLGLGPDSLTVVAVEIAHHRIGHAMAREVAAAVPAAVAQVIACLDDLDDLDEREPSRAHPAAEGPRT